MHSLRTALAMLALAGILSMVSACTSPIDDSERHSLGNDERVRTFDTVEAIVTGTTRFMPELGVFDRAPVGDDVQSTYSRTTVQNREMRRGMIEFALPGYDGEIVAATLLLERSGGFTSFPLPPDRHIILGYAADYAVETDDHFREGVEIATIDTDANLEQQSYRIDVTSMVRRYQGAGLGLLIQLAIDTTYNELDNERSELGHGFMAMTNPDLMPRIVVETLE